MIYSVLYQKLLNYPTANLNSKSPVLGINDTPYLNFCASSPAPGSTVCWFCRRCTPCLEFMSHCMVSPDFRGLVGPVLTQLWESTWKSIHKATPLHVPELKYRIAQSVMSIQNLNLLTICFG